MTSTMQKPKRKRRTKAEMELYRQSLLSDPPAKKRKRRTKIEMEAYRQTIDKSSNSQRKRKRRTKAEMEAYRESLRMLAVTEPSSEKSQEGSDAVDEISKTHYFKANMESLGYNRHLYLRFVDTFMSDIPEGLFWSIIKEAKKSDENPSIVFLRHLFKLLGVNKDTVTEILNKVQNHKNNVPQLYYKWTKRGPTF